VVGLCMHGGEWTNNVTAQTPDAVEEVGFTYDTTSAIPYYFPYRLIDQTTEHGIAPDGRLRPYYRLSHVSGDIKVSPGPGYARRFYEEVMRTMDQVYEQNGVFVLMLHPVYFGFFSYVFHPRNLVRLARYLWRSLNRQRG
jgi:hypothetical protein